ncbi:MAG: PGPGW domain-containing protein [Candidatus Angelobacter sp.]
MWRRVLVGTAGWSLLVLGLAGLFLPVLPGVLLALVGLALLSTEYHWARRWMTRLRLKFPQTDRKIQRFLGKNAKYILGTNSSSSGK